LTRDVGNIVLEIIRGEWISFAKGRQIYRPKVNLDNMLLGENDLPWGNDKMEKGGEIDSSKLMEDFKEYLMGKVFEYEPFVVKEIKNVSRIPCIPFYKKKVFLMRSAR